MIYFNALLQSTRLNAIESVELARPVIMQNKLNLIENWIKENKLTMSDELGDIIRQANPAMALQIYQQSLTFFCCTLRRKGPLFIQKNWK